MKESVTYQGILEDGMAMGEARGIAMGEVRGIVKAKIESLLFFGSRMFGPADAAVKERLAGIQTPAQLDALYERCFSVSSWQELLKDA